jgi:hypothetical protein
MKPINFLRTLNHHQQKSLRRWAQITLATSAFVGIGITTLQSMQLYELYTAYTTCNTAQCTLNGIQTAINSQTDLDTEKSILQSKRTKLANTMSKLARTQEHLKAFQNYIYAPLNLQTYKLDKKHFEITATCGQLQDALRAVKQLEDYSSFKQVQLVSLESYGDDQRLLVTIRGNIV